MPRQKFLHELLLNESERHAKTSKEVNILNWNIRNPSRGRAEAQCEWILATGASVVVLTEAKYSEGCRFMRDWLRSYGFQVELPNPGKDDYCVMIGARGMPCEAVALGAAFLPHRMQCLCLNTAFGRIRVIGTYVPSRGPIERRNEDKRLFQDGVSQIVPEFVLRADDGELVICGDMNVIERTHVPHYSVFGEWEYAFYESFLNAGLLDAFREKHDTVHEHSWFGRAGDGYRFDHFFISRRLSRFVSACSYDHGPRLRGLSDHSAMVLTLHAQSDNAGDSSARD
jgi:exodeoxyribonuclease III